MNRYEGRVLLALVLLAGGVWLFIFLADQVVGRDPRTLDIQILLAMREPGDNADPLGPPWLGEMTRDFTALGGAGLQTMILTLVCGYLILIRKYNAMLLLISAIVGAWVLNSLLKELFERPRPDLVPHGMMVYQASFPSGHAMSAAAFYLTLGVLLVRLHTRRHIQGYFMGAAILITVIVGISRIYLGVHWPSDVLAGWVMGGVWAILCWMLTRWLQRRGQVEQAGEEGKQNRKEKGLDAEQVRQREP
ncbi:MAG: phosphatase PAP2 family protein [Caldilineaceae bacterium]|nr:phosphatase PAP2 family protein [Caldilineaceae bacterium]